MRGPSAKATVHAVDAVNALGMTKANRQLQGFSGPDACLIHLTTNGERHCEVSERRASVLESGRRELCQCGLQQRLCVARLANGLAAARLRGEQHEVTASVRNEFVRVEYPDTLPRDGPSYVCVERFLRPLQGTLALELTRGMNPIQLAQIMGHSSLAMIQNVYSHLTPRDAYSALERVIRALDD
jgi:hypothetical protein